MEMRRLLFSARLFPPASQSLVPSNYPPLQAPGGTAETSAWSTGSCQRTSARTSCSSGASPATLQSRVGGSSRRVASNARCAATTGNPDQRATQADRAAGRSAAGTAEDLCCANRRSHVAASLPKRPPTSTPTTTKRQPRRRTSSGYVWRRLRRAAASRAWPGCTAASGCASPARVTGLTMVASTACCEPCHRASPLATTSMRRSSAALACPPISDVEAHEVNALSQKSGKPSCPRTLREHPCIINDSYPREI